MVGNPVAQEPAEHDGARLPRLPLLAGLVLIAAIVTSCTVMESQRITPEATDLAFGTQCASRLGSYSLPRAHLRIQVGQAAGENAKPRIVAYKVNGQPDRSVQTIRHPDQALTFCLDHVNSYFSDDKISIIKWPLIEADVTQETKRQEVRDQRGSFLGAVSVNATDQSVYIINTLIRAIFIVLSGDKDFGEGRRALLDTAAVILADLEYDPFNPLESATVNARLSKLGFCLVLEGYTFDTSQASIDQYCNNPESYSAVTAIVTKAYMRVAAIPLDPRLPGIHYRPRYPYRLFTFQKTDRQGPERWSLSRMDTVELENMSPVMTLKIDRAAFAARSAY